MNQYFEPALAAQQSSIYSNFGDMARERAATVEKTREKAGVFEKRRRQVEEITREKVADWHAKTVMTAIIDLTTRAHATKFQGAAFSYRQYKDVVFEFVNGNITAKPEDKITNDKNLKQVQESGSEGGGENDEDEWGGHAWEEVGGNWGGGG